MQFVAAMREQGILIMPMGGQRVRAVTHLDISAGDIVRTLDAVRRCMATGFRDQATVGSGPYAK